MRPRLPVQVPSPAGGTPGRSTSTANFADGGGTSTRGGPVSRYLALRTIAHHEDGGGPVVPFLLVAGLVL